MLSQEEVIKRLCAVASRVGDKKFNHTVPHDCFCVGQSTPCLNDFQFDEEVLTFIEDAVDFELAVEETKQREKDY